MFGTSWFSYTFESSIRASTLTLCLEGSCPVFHPKGRLVSRGCSKNSKHGRISSTNKVRKSFSKNTTLGAFLSGQSDRIVIPFGLIFSCLTKTDIAIGLEMFCKQRSFGTPRTVHRTKSCLKLSFYRSIRIHRWILKRYRLHLFRLFFFLFFSFFFSFLFFFFTPVYGKMIFSFFVVPPSHNYILDHPKQHFFIKCLLSTFLN